MTTRTARWQQSFWGARSTMRTQCWQALLWSPSSSPVAWRVYLPTRKMAPVLGTTGIHGQPHGDPAPPTSRFSSVQFSSVSQLCLTLCDQPNYSKLLKRKECFWIHSKRSASLLYKNQTETPHTHTHKKKRERERELLTNITDEVVKNLLAIQETANAGDAGSTPRSRRSPREGNGKPLLWECILAYIILLYSCLGNPMDKGAWQTTVHGVTEESDMT